MAVSHLGRYVNRFVLVFNVTNDYIIVEPNNTGALFAIMALLGICTITMLPIGLELGCELTRNADGSSAVVWFL